MRRATAIGRAHRQATRTRAAKRRRAARNARRAACGEPADGGAPPVTAGPLSPDLADRTSGTSPLAGRPFAADSPWNARVPADARIAPDSGTLVTSLAQQVATYNQWINTTAYSTPIYRVGPDQPLVRVIQDTGNPTLVRDFAAVPLPADARGAAGSDASAIVWQPSTDTLWEFWRLRRQEDGWYARWGGRITDVSRSSGVFPAPYGTSASGMALLGGLILPEEIEAGEINHALAIGVPRTAPTFVAPANRTDGRTDGGIPIGTRLRLDPAVDVASLGLSRTARIMAVAAQRYGIYVRDSSGAVPFYAQDPVNLGIDPWPRLLGFQSPSRALAGFPWARLQVVLPPDITT